MVLLAARRIGLVWLAVRRGKSTIGSVRPELVEGAQPEVVVSVLRRAQDERGFCLLGVQRIPGTSQNGRD